MNKFEEQIALELHHWADTGAISFEFEGTTINYVKPEPQRVYTPDFIVCKDNKLMFIETKGYFRPEHRTKMRHVKKCNPELDIRIIFQRNQFINKSTGYDYCKWAERNNFPCAIGTLPKEWLK
jgi:hypothetical protein